MTASVNRRHNPFPGLRPFDFTENHLFFGRDDQGYELLKKLARKRFVAVVGTSGCGKSSLVRAGLLPALHGGFMTKAGSVWRIIIFRPGNDPIGNLARALNSSEVYKKASREIPEQATIIEITLRRGDLGMVEAIRQARLPANENLLVVVDQFEELFRFKNTMAGDQSKDEAAAFVALLLEAAKNQQLPIYVALTMRSDFLGECAQFRDLPEAINEGQYLVPRMTRDQRRSAITGPIAVGGGEISPRLVQQLLNDVGDQPDQLPILQHALMRTWDYWTSSRKNGTPIDLDDYTNIGGMNHALSHHADEAYQELPDERHRKICEILFKTLTERSADNREIRRPTKLRQISDIARASEQDVVYVIDVFRQAGRSFLMPPPGIKLSSDSLIDISHESLIRNWQQLKEWVEEESRSAQIYRRLAETATLFHEKKAGYWRDPDLQITLNWREQEEPNAAWAHLYHPQFDEAIHFLEQSRIKRDAEIEEARVARERELDQARALAAEQSKAAKRLRITLALLIIVIVAGIFTIITFTQRRQALEEAEKAAMEKSRSDSTAHAFADLYQAADSLRLIAAGAALSEKNARLESEQQRQLALAARDVAGTERERAEIQAQLAERSRTEAIAARDTALNSKRQVQAVALAIKSGRMRTVGDDTLSALLALESYRFDQLSGSQFRNEVYNALRLSLNALGKDEGGPEVMTASDFLITASDFSRARSSLALGNANGTLQIDPLESSRSAYILGSHQGTITALAFTPDGTLLASAGTDNHIKIWHPDHEKSDPLIMGDREEQIWRLVFHPDGRRIVSGSTDGILRIWQNWQAGAESKIMRRNQGSILTLAFNDQGTQMASGSADGTVWLWQFSGSDLPVVSDSINFTSDPQAIDFNPDGTSLAIGLEDGTLKLLNLTEKNNWLLKGHQRRINMVAFDPHGDLLASGSSDQTIRLWRLDQLDSDPIVLSANQSSIRSVYFTGSGDTLIATTFDKQILLWHTRTEVLAGKIRHHVRRQLTEEEWQEFVGRDTEYPYAKQKN